jgi:hypothetical protein
MFGGPFGGAAVESQAKNLNREYRMSGWIRKSSALLLGAVVLAVGISCSAGDSMGPSDDQPSQSLVGTLGNTVGSTVNALKNLHLLSCSTQPYAVATKSIGSEGGVIVVGTHRLTIPAGALNRVVSIKAEQVSGKVNSVRLSPEGLQFAKPASLELSYRNCSPLLGILKHVAYTDEQLRILDLIPSLDLLNLQTVRGSIRHFSRYAVAW